MTNVQSEVDQELSRAELEAASGEECRLLSSDVYLFNGPLEDESSDAFVDLIEARTSHKQCASLLVSTNGGTADAAYVVSKCLRRAYEHVTVYVFGRCKSAGTLLVLGSHEMVLGPRSELGPLDVQILNEDVLTPRSSGLDLYDALQAIREEAFAFFENAFLELKMRSGGTISTRTAADVANALTIGLFSPITEQIDVLLMGKIRRAMRIAKQYGRQLGAGDSILSRLINDYPSHDFIIDCEEAFSLFPNARPPTDREARYIDILRRQVLSEQQRDLIRVPQPRPTIAPIEFADEFFSPVETEDDKSKEQSDQASEDATGSDSGKAPPPSALGDDAETVGETTGKHNDTDHTCTDATEPAEPEGG